ncbi:MAG: hypothetical protein AABY93_15115 [Bacteroidota bacterium]
MKKLLNYLYFAAILTLSFSCDNNIEVVNDGCLQGKFIKGWCEADHGIVQVLSNFQIGQEWTHRYQKFEGDTIITQTKYDNAVFVELEGISWSSVLGSPDSTFYFNYSFKSEKTSPACSLCCAPLKFIFITSVLSKPCAPNSEGPLPAGW